MNVVFIIYVGNSFGDATFFINFANQLKSANINSFFVVPPLVSNYIKSYGFEVYNFTSSFNKNIELLDKLIKKTNPSLLIFSNIITITSLDFLPRGMQSFKDKHLILKSFIENIMRSLVQTYNLPILALPSYPHRGPINKKEVDIIKSYYPDKVYYLFPCPYAFPNYNDPSFFYWKIYDKKPFINKEKKEKIRETLNCKKEDKIVFTTVGLWSYTGTISLKPMYYKLLRELLIYYLSQLPFNIHLINVDPGLEQSSQRSFYPNVFIHNFNLLEAEEYENLLLSSDLFIGEYFFQSSLIKSFMSDIPVLLLQNTLLLQDITNVLEKNLPVKNPEILSLISKTFQGMIKSNGKNLSIEIAISNEFVKEEPFYKCLNKSEIFNHKTIYNQLYDLLTNKNVNNNIRDYKNSIKDLPLALDILSKIVNFK